MNVIDTTEKAILDICNNIEIFRSQKWTLLLVTTALISRIDTSTSDNLIIDTRNSHFY